MSQRVCISNTAEKRQGIHLCFSDDEETPFLVAYDKKTNCGIIPV